MDPNEEIPSKTGFVDDPDLWPQSGLPSGVERDSKKWYAHRRTYKNGRVVWEFYRRGSPLPAGQQANDPIVATMETVDTKAEEEWKKEREKAEKEASNPTIRNINGIPHERRPDGTWTPVQTQQGPAQATPSQRQRRTRTDIEGTPDPSKPGGWDNERPRAIVRDIETGEVLSDEPLTGGALRAWQEDRERSRNPGGLTDAQIRAQQQEARAESREERATRAAERAAQPKPAAVREYDGTDPQTGRPARVTEYSDGSKTYEELKPGQQQSPYSHIQQDKESGRWYGLKRDGSGWVELPGGPGAPQPRSGPAGRAPSMPQIVVGAAQDALRQYYDDIQAEVDSGRRSAAWGENRRREAFEVAQMTVQEAQLHEQSRQYNQTQAYNLATFKASYGQNALENAMRFTLSILDTLEPGSGSGGNFFKALFGLQMQLLRDSGIYGIVPGGGRSSVGDPATRPPMTPPRVNITRPEDAQRTAEQARANIAAGLEASGAPREYTPASATGDGRPAEPRLPEPVFRPQPPAPEPGAVRPGPDPAPANALGVGVVPDVLQPGAAVPPGMLSPDPPDIRSGGLPADATTVSYLGTPEQVARSASWRAPFTLDPAAYGHTPENPLAPPDPSAPGRFAALDALADKVQPQLAAGAALPRIQVTPEMVSDPDALPSAVRRAQVAATPPWRLPEDQLERLVLEFGPETVFSLGLPNLRRPVGVG